MLFESNRLTDVKKESMFSDVKNESMFSLLLFYHYLLSYNGSVAIQYQNLHERLRLF